MTFEAVDSYIKEVLLLCYIPAQHIKLSFEKLTSRGQLTYIFHQETEVSQDRTRNLQVTSRAIA